MTACRRSTRLGSSLLGALVMTTIGCAQTLPTAPFARIVVKQTRTLDADRLPTREIAVLLDASVAIAEPERVSETERGAYSAQPCRVASEIVQSFPSAQPVRIQPFYRPGSRPSECRIERAQPSDSLVSSDPMEARDATSALQAWLKTWRGSRISIIAEIADDAEPGFCSRARAAAERGIWVDVVRLGAVPLDRDCLGELPQADDARTSEALQQLMSAPRPFRVLRHGDDGELSLVTRSTGSAEPLEVGPGFVTIVLEGTPEESIGPLLLREGTLTQVHTFETEAIDGAPPRAWWDVETWNAGR